MPLAPTPGYLSNSLSGFEGQPTAFEAPSLLPTLLNTGLSVLFVSLLVYLVYWLLRRWRAVQGVDGPGREEGLIHVLEKNYVDAKHGLAVVEMAGEVYMLGLGDEVSLLARISDPAAVEKIKASAPIPGGLLGFREQFERIGSQLRRDQWKKSKQALRTQTEALGEQIERLKPSRKKDKV